MFFDKRHQFLLQVRLEDLRLISKFHRVSKAAFVDALKLDLYRVDSVDNRRGRSRGVVIVEGRTGEDFLYCEFNKNRRVLVQVVCRHFHHQMGLLKEVSDDNGKHRNPSNEKSHTSTAIVTFGVMDL